GQEACDGEGRQRGGGSGLSGCLTFSSAPRLPLVRRAATLAATGFSVPVAVVKDGDILTQATAAHGRANERRHGAGQRFSSLPTVSPCVITLSWFCSCSQVADSKADRRHASPQGTLSRRPKGLAPFAPTIPLTRRHDSIERS